MEPVTTRFIARSRTHRYWKVIALVAPVTLVAGGMAWSALEAVLPALVYKVLSPILWTAFVVGYLAAFLRDTLGRKVTLDVERDHLVVDGGRGGVFPLAGAALGLFRTSQSGIVQGTILQLTSGHRRFRIGGIGHRTRPGVRVALPAEESYDVYFTAPGLDVTSIFGMDAGEPAGSKSFKALVDLMSIPVDNALLPEVLCCEAYGYMALDGLYWRVVPKGWILVGPRDLSLRDAEGRTVWTTPRSAMAVRWGQHTYRAGRSSFTHAVLQIWAGGRCALAIGIYDFRFGWHGPTRALDEPGHMVSTQDWEGIVARLGLGQWMRGPPPD